MIQYNLFYRNFVLRHIAQFTRPPLPMVTRFELPTMAMVHHVSASATNPWPSEDMLFYQNNDKPLRITHHTELAELKGNPRLEPGDVNNLIRQFRSSHPRFRPSVDIESMKREPRTVITHNYGLLLTRYKYQRNLFTFHNRWHNVFATLFQSIGMNVKTGYHQYVELQLPKTLPSMSVLNKSLDGWNARNMGLFNNYELIFLHHLWAWMGERRHEVSMMNKYIPDMSNVKIVLREGERFTVIDMALLEEWRKPSAYERAEYEKAKKENPTLEPLKKGKVTPTELQKLFLRSLMGIMELRSKDLPEFLDGEENPTGSPVTDDMTNVVETDGDQLTTTSATQDDEVTEAAAFAGYDEEADRMNLLAEIDKDLEALEITGQGDENAAIPQMVEGEDPRIDGSDITSLVSENTAAPTVRAPEFFPTEPTEAFRQLLIRAADSGAVTAAEYRRLMDSSEYFKSMPAPLDVNETMGEFVQIKPELLKIDEQPSIPDQDTIVDKSMLKSTLLNWNERYARNIMQRDIAGMVSQLQAAGIMIGNYEVEEVEDITGSHYEYKIQVKPIEGSSSTLSMKIPKVDDEGNFKINGVNYRMRMQRGD